MQEFLNVRIVSTEDAQVLSSPNSNGKTHSARLKVLQAEPTEVRPETWIAEYLTPYDAYYHGVKELLLFTKTKHQSMIIADVGHYGRALFLDGKIQTTEGDEPFYHEPLVHAACITHAAPNSVLILGGADGGAAREALRWSTVRSVTVVDIDADVVEACRTYLPKISRGSFESPRTKLVVRDALEFIDSTAEEFDVIICDLTDPMEDSPSLSLFTDIFFQQLRSKLSPRGAISIQAGPASLKESPTVFPRIYATLKQVFMTVRTFQVFVPTFGSPLAMIVATMCEDDLQSVEEVDAMLDALEGELSVLDGHAFHGMFALPRHVKKALAKENGIFTASNRANAYGKGRLSVGKGT